MSPDSIHYSTGTNIVHESFNSMIYVIIPKKTIEFEIFKNKKNVYIVLKMNVVVTESPFKICLFRIYIIVPIENFSLI